VLPCFHLQSFSPFRYPYRKLLSQIAKTFIPGWNLDNPGQFGWDSRENNEVIPHVPVSRLCLPIIIISCQLRQGYTFAVVNQHWKAARGRKCARFERFYYENVIFLCVPCKFVQGCSLLSLKNNQKFVKECPTELCLYSNFLYAALLGTYFF
jgi:hypothetical protein